MAASVIINRLTGAGPTTTDITSATNRMSTSDVVAPGTSDPIPIPGAGTNYSYWVTTRLEVITTAPDNGINNIKWYSDATGFGTGLTCMGDPATAYTQAAGGGHVQGTTGDVLNSTNYTSLTSASGTDVTTYTSGASKSVTGSIGASLGEFGDRFVYQLGVGSTAGVGTMTARTFTWQFDET